MSVKEKRSVGRKTAPRPESGVFSSDIRHIAQSGVAIALVAVLIIVPCIFAWANILASWDPYIEESTANIPIAVANEDIGFDVMGISLGMGDIVASKLLETKILKWQPVDSREEAVAAVNSGKCYAAVIVPSNFSASFLSLFEGEDALAHPTLEFYQNSKKNAVVTSLLIKARNTIVNNVNSSLMGTIGDAIDTICHVAAASGVDPDRIGDVIAVKLDDLTVTMDQLLLVIEALQQLANDGTDLLSSAAGTVYSLGDILASAETALGNANNSLATGGVLINTSLNGIVQLLSDIDKTLSDIVSSGQTGSNPFVPVSDALTRYLAKLETMRPMYENDPLALAAIDEARSYLNQALAVASSASLPDPGDAQRNAILGYIDNAASAISSSSAAVGKYSGQIIAQQTAVMSLKNDISSNLTIITFGLNRESYMSRASDIVSSLNSMAGSKPYRDYDATGSSLSAAAQSVGTALDLITATTDLGSFALNKSSIESALNEAALVLTAAQTPFPSALSNIEEIADQVGLVQSVVKSEFGAEASLHSQLDKLAVDIQRLADEVDIPTFRNALMNVAESISTMTGFVDSLALPESFQAFAEAGRQARTYMDAATAILSGPLLQDASTLITQIRSILYSLQGTMLDGAGIGYQLSKALGEYANAMGSTGTTLDMAVDLIEKLNGYVSKLATDFEKITTTEGYSKFMEVIRKNPDAIADYISTPVELDTVDIYPVENYGSSMTAYYLMFALYLGTLLPPVFIKVRRFRNDGLEYYGMFTRFFGRYGIFFLLNIAQGLLAGLGCLYFIRIQCVSPLAFIFASVLSAVAFGMINYALAFSMDMMGIGLSGIAMIIQIAGADGTYPVEVIPDIFIKMYDHMPFRYGMNMVRDSICGRYADTYVDSAIVLGAVIVGSIIVGLVLYYPSKLLTDRLGKSMEETGIMS